VIIEEPIVLANPADEERARRYAERCNLSLLLHRCVPAGQVVVIDPTASTRGEPHAAAPKHR
jgi:hypothetical protein